MNSVVDLSNSTFIQKPRFYIVGDKATFVKYGVDPQEEYMIKEDIESSIELEKFYGLLKSKEVKL
jgi:hypothetical protein